MEEHQNKAGQGTDFRREFVRFALDTRVLLFGEFKTKAGRLSPYFFNAGLFNDGASLGQLGAFYAQALLAEGASFDMLFGPAYKGIPLVSATAIALAQLGRNVPFAFNRKEAKDHGEGGVVVGAALKGQVLIVDDVISAGTSVRESVEIIREAGATPSGVVIALDRQERGQDVLSAAQEVRARYGIPVHAICRLQDVIDTLAQRADLAPHLRDVLEYRRSYGVQT